MRPGRWADDCILQSVGPDAEYHVDMWHQCTAQGGTFHVNTEARTTALMTKLLHGMKATPSGSSNLLDESLCVYGTQMSYDHSNNAHSFLIAGKAGGKLSGGRVFKFGNPLVNAPTGRSHNDLLVSLCRLAGFPEVNSYGDPMLCSGGLTELG